MKAERWEHIKQICSEALERDAAGREEFLEEACAGDPLLRKEVESLLAQQSAADDFIESPALEVAARELAASKAGSRSRTSPAALSRTTGSSTRSAPAAWVLFAGPRTCGWAVSSP